MPVLNEKLLGTKTNKKGKSNTNNLDIAKITDKECLKENYLNCSKLIAFKVAYRQLILLNEMLLSSEGYFQKLKKQSIMFGKDYLIACCTKNAEYVKNNYSDMFKYAIPDISNTTSGAEIYNNIFMLEALSILCSNEFKPQYYINSKVPQLSAVYMECIVKCGNVSNLVPVVAADSLHTLYMQCVGEVSLISVLYGSEKS